jgi:spoIIIJ-associated protein
MKTIVREGKSTEAIVKQFMKEFSLNDRESFTYEILEEGTKGFLIFGRKPTVLKFNVPESTESLKEFVEKFLDKIDVKAKEVKVTTTDKAINVVIVEPDNPGFLIGKDARFLDSFQHILNRRNTVDNGKRIPVILDVDDYRERRTQGILRKANFIISKVKKREKSFAMEAMNSQDRKLVHQFIERDKDLRTLTVGKGEMKKIVIFPAKNFDQLRNKRNTKRDDNRN